MNLFRPQRSFISGRQLRLVFPAHDLRKREGFGSSAVHAFGLGSADIVHFSAPSSFTISSEREAFATSKGEAGEKGN